MARKTLFDWRKRRLLRKQISFAEQLSVIAIAVSLGALVWWVGAQRDAYDPTERDLPVELLSADGPKIRLYHQPLKPWVEPGQASNQAPTLSLGPFPPSLIDANWALAGRIRSFDSSNLYEKINGEAEKFIKQGFRRLHYVVLRGTDGSEMALELYDQSDIGGSIGIFAAHKPANADIVERVGVTFFTTSVGLIGRTGQFFFRAAADRSTNLVKEKSRALVETLSQLTAAAAAAPQPVQTAAPAPAPAGPAEMQLLMKALQLKESAMTFEAANVFQFDFAENFWFGQLEGESRAFIHVADNSEAADALFTRLLDELAYEHDHVRNTEDGVVLKHKFLGTFFMLSRNGHYLLGAENLTEENQGSGAITRLTKAAQP